MMKVVNFFLSMIMIWVDKYYFRCNLAIGNGIIKFITISVLYYNFGCQFSTEIVIKSLLQFRSVITILGCHTVLNRNCNNQNVIKSLFQFRLIHLFQNDESCEFFVVNDHNLG